MTSPFPTIPLARDRLLVIGTGAIAVSALPNWLLLLRAQYPWTVRACLTEAAATLVAPDALAAVTGAPVLGPGWPTAAGGVPHVEAAEWADLVLVLPASADFVAKCAHGIADSLGLAIVQHTPAPVVLVPALSTHSAAKPAVRRALAQAEADGLHVVPPAPAASVHGASGAAMADLVTVLQHLSRVTRPAS
jgi:phosphopantothenoylcysteine decarboxylase / phosphopantothenate---cysteine ligase